MSFFDLFRSFFGINRHNEPGTSGLGDHDPYRESFRNPIWQTDEDDDDDMDDIRFSMPGMHFRIFSDPFQITRYFESQMDNMLKDFGFGFNGFFGDKAIEAVPFDGLEDKGNLRDRMLKSEPDAFSIMKPEQKIDTDLDGKINKDEFLKMWKKKDTEETVKKPFNFSGRSVTKQIIRRPDGTVEHKQVFRDSEGNQQTIVSKEIGDKKYVVTTKKDKDGIETQSEDLFNMDESELKDFNEKWASRNNANNVYDGNLRHFPWEKFFGPMPKL